MLLEQKKNAHTFEGNSKRSLKIEGGKSSEKVSRRIARSRWLIWEQTTAGAAR